MGTRPDTSYRHPENRPVLFQAREVREQCGMQADHRPGPAPRTRVHVCHDLRSPGENPVRPAGGPDCRNAPDDAQAGAEFALPDRRQDPVRVCRHPVGLCGCNGPDHPERETELLAGVRRLPEVLGNCGGRDGDGASGRGPAGACGSDQDRDRGSGERVMGEGN